MSPEIKRILDQKIKKSLEELKLGKGIPIKKAMKWLIKKYNLS